MKIRLKKLNRQVMVITGASSGIGLCTARMAAERGVRLMLGARNDEALRELVQEINETGGEAYFVKTDVTREQDVKRLAREAVRQFGGFDTWVNNAGISIYGRLEEVAIEDLRQLFETNFWGVVYGSRIAAQHLREHAGVLINIGSALSDRAFPLQGMYSASKHAVKGFTDALRMELEEEQAPVSVTLIKPSAIDTPYTRHAKNYLDVEPKNPPPVYAPELVAKAILHAAEHPERDIFVGSAGKAISIFGQYAPRVTDRYMEKAMFSGQQTEQRARKRTNSSLYAPSHEAYGEERGDYDGPVRESSIFTGASRHPVLTSALAVGGGLALAALLRNRGTEANGRFEQARPYAARPAQAGQSSASDVRGL